MSIHILKLPWSVMLLLLQLSAVIPPGFCVTVAALEIQMKENSQLQEAVAALNLECSTGRDLGALQEQCSRWANGVWEYGSFVFSSIHIYSLTGLLDDTSVLLVQNRQHTKYFMQQ